MGFFEEAGEAVETVFVRLQFLLRRNAVQRVISNNFSIIHPVGDLNGNRSGNRDESGRRGHRRVGNVSDDVETIQLLLQHIARRDRFIQFNPGPINGIISNDRNDPTVEAIRAFQRTFGSSDGRVDPDGATHRRLRREARDVQIELLTASMQTPNAGGLPILNQIMDWESYFPRPIADEISPTLWYRALNSLREHVDNEGLIKPHIITLVDFDLNSTNTKRLWVIDLFSRRLLFNEYVAHGCGGGSGQSRNQTNRCAHVGNINGSNLSCIGGFLTGVSRSSTAGSPGRTVSRRALKVHGLDEGNDLAYSRYILFHGAHYCEDTGCTGMSHGCFATTQSVMGAIMPVIEEGSFVYAFKAQ